MGRQMLRRNSPVAKPVWWDQISAERQADLNTIGWDQQSWDYDQERRVAPAPKPTPKPTPKPAPIPRATPPQPDSPFVKGLKSVVMSPGGFFWAACLVTPPLLELIIPIGAPLGLEYFLAWPCVLWHSIGLAVIFVTFSDEKKLASL